MPTNETAQAVQWDLGKLYSDTEDPQLEADIASFAAQAQRFHSDYKGSLATKLGAAISDYSLMDMLGNKIMLYLFLRQSLNTADAIVNSKIAEVERRLSGIQGEYLTFFTLELVALEETLLETLYQTDPVVAKHRPWIEHARIWKPHLLTEPVESALTKRSPFGPSSWSEFFDEFEADLRFSWENESRSLTEMLSLLSNSKDPAERARIQEIVNAGLGGTFAKYSAQTLYVVVGEGAVEQKERKYLHPMEARNKENRIPDEVVSALHQAVTTVAAPIARRYYSLKAKVLGLKTLKWSDRNAPLPFTDTATIPFEEAMATVLSAYESFSSTLAGIIRQFLTDKAIDAPAQKGKRGGAFNYSVVLPGGLPVSYIFLNYLGSTRDVMTLAHELGHGVHGLLAGQAQGTLMAQAPIAYAETASVFGEMTTFNFLRAKWTKENNNEALFALLAGKVEDALNTVVRQIGFSNFERQLHGMDPGYTKWEEPKKRAAEELDALWLATLREFYGTDGEVFTYENTSHLWTYISHFHRPFYVYGYAFGELLTQSLYAQQAQLGDRFEPLYLDLLRSGGTKNTRELLSPFGLDPTNTKFWTDGLAVSLEVMVTELETVWEQMNQG